MAMANAASRSLIAAIVSAIALKCLRVIMCPFLFNMDWIIHVFGNFASILGILDRNALVLLRENAVSVVSEQHVVYLCCISATL